MQTVNVQSGMNLAELQANWDEFGKSDPLWAILTAPDKRGGRWEPDEFFASGQAEIAEVLNHVQSLRFRLKRRRALDFGCGVGRLTRALCGFFKEYDGVDIAPSMIELARQYNRFGARCRYHVNSASDLSLFARDSFDFVYSNIVLQHIRPDYSAAYLREFMRVLVPGGLAVFQLPSEQVGQDSMEGAAGDAIPLSASGFNARIQPGQLPASVKAGSRLTITVRVKNTGGAAWPSRWLADGRYCIQLGNHWLDQGGQVIQNDDGRAPLPHDVPPGGDIELSFSIRAPLVDGACFLELDMVQEGVAWFKQRGSVTVVTPVQVVGGQPVPASLPAAGPAATEGAVTQPVMELHGIPKPQVIALLREAGGRVIDVQRYDVCGPYWNSYRYCVAKKWKPSDVWRRFRNSASRLWRPR
jgi:SAM-dependent methyltransferase